MPIGVPELLILTPVLIALAFFLFRGRLFPGTLRSRARRFGYASTRAYLRSAPRSDPEKQDAADLALRGLVWCLVGLLFPPLVLVGLIPLFYGGRKLVYASMGLGLVDDQDQSEA
jgi:hypothetical protein